MEYNYVMLVDEKGQPYLAHAGGLRQTFQNVGNAVKNTAKNAGAGLGRGVRQTHKYIMKVGDAAKPRYLYTQEEVRAYMQGGRRAVTNAANRAGQAARNAVNKVTDKAKDIAGLDERERFEQAKKDNEAARRSAERMNATAKRLNNEANRSTDLSEIFDKRSRATDLESKANDLWLEGKRNLDSAKYEYDRSLVGIADKSKDAINKAGDAIKSKYDRMRDEFKDTADKAKDAVNKVADKVKDTFRKEPPKAELSPEGTERIIKENIIPETIIREDKIYEDKIKENATPEKRIIEKVVSEGKVRKNQDKTAEKVDSEPKTKDGYEKKPNPRNSSGVISSDTIYADAKEAGLNVDAYRKANDEFYKLSRELMKKYSEPKTGAESLVRRMYYEDPAYIAAREKLKEEEAKVVAKLYK